jgi:asparagine synthase (glutamine-hydrolysing)
MCGILGVFRFSDQGIPRDRLPFGPRALRHRGPDSQHFWVSPDSRVALGHTRLSIIDLTTGDQPIANEDGRIHLVANGEIYDHERLQNELRARGHQLRTKSDSETILHLYEEYGADCLRELRGEFAFALWDAANRSLMLARDRFGIKPLFYSRFGDTLYFASEAKALFAMGVPAEWDEESVYHSHFAPTLPHRSLFKNVYQVPAGHFLMVTPHQMREFPYWDFDYPLEKVSREKAPPLEEAVRLVRSSLEESVRLRLRADVPVGVYLSGGLDSSAILGISARQSPKPLPAFTLSFDHSDYNEIALARETAKFAGSELTEIPVREQDLADHYDDALWQGEFIPANSHSVAKFLLSRAVRDAGFKVVLTGEGSDEIFGGYAHFRKDLIFTRARRGEASADAQGRELDALVNGNRVSAGLLLAGAEAGNIPIAERVLGFTPGFLEAHASAGGKVSGIYREEFRARYGGSEPLRFYLSAFDIERQMRGRHPVHQSMYLWSKTSLQNYLLSMLGDRMEMGHSLEGRVPFLDHKFVETVVRLPLEMKINGLNEKFILKEAARPFLTETLYQRQKHPFMAPPAASRASGPMATFVQDTLRSRALEDQPFFAPEKVRGLLDALPLMSAEARAALDPGLMLLVGTVRMSERLRAQNSATGFPDLRPTYCLRMNEHRGVTRKGYG